MPGNYTAIQQAREAQRFWQHLANSGLISGQFSGAAYTGHTYSQEIGISSPAMSFSKAVGISNFGHINDIMTYASYFPVYYNMVFYIGKQYPDVLTLNPFISPLGAYNIDSKIDDGKPGTGKIMSMRPSFNSNCASGDDASTATYLTAQTGANCTILLNAVVN